jgi:hypothetical protein
MQLVTLKQSMASKLKLRCTTATLLLLAALAAIACGGAVAWTKTGIIDRSVQWRFGGLEMGAVYLGIVSPFWLPIAFIAYSIGRRAITYWTVLAFALCEAASVMLVYLWWKDLLF